LSGYYIRVWVNLEEFIVINDRRIGISRLRMISQRFTWPVIALEPVTDGARQKKV
jgi:hypothetical protein